MGFTGYLEVEARIIDQHHRVGAHGLRAHCINRHAKIRPNVGEMAQHFAESHIRHVTYVHQRSRPGSSSHKVTSEKREARALIDATKSTDEGCGMKVAGGFSGRYEVTHHSGDDVLRFLSTMAVRVGR